MRRLLHGGLCACVLAGTAWSAHALDAEGVYAKVVPSVWTIVASNAQARTRSQGSAVVVGPGRLVTNCHVLARMTRIEVIKDNVSYTGQLEFPDPDNDLCQVRVANFTAPAVALAETEQLRVGMRVYAIGTPQGLETTLSDGLLSGLRRDESGRLVFVQTTAPISPGSSGGGLFDSEGRLVGITTFIRRESQNINLAVPSWQVAELPERGRQMLDRRSAAAPAGAPAPTGAVSGNTAPDAQRRAGDWFEYVITDAVSKGRQSVFLKVDHVHEDRVVFNGGAREEDLSGRVLLSTAYALTELDAVTPPGGWLPQGQAVPARRAFKFRTRILDREAHFDLTASMSGEQVVRVKAGSFAAVRIDLDGWHGRQGVFSMPSVRYNATVWYAPQLQRVIRFTVQTRTPNVGAAGWFWVDESLELERTGR